jgi:hypothetical protein
MDNRVPGEYRKIEAYTNGFEIVVMGMPVEVPEGDPLFHSCDEMGCGSLDHVVARVPIRTKYPYLLPADLQPSRYAVIGADDG